jgi:hypothetical protein
MPPGNIRAWNRKRKLGFSSARTSRCTSVHTPDKDVPRNTKHVTFIGQVTVNSSTSTFTSGATSSVVGVMTWAAMPDMMSSEEKSFSTSQVELQNKPADEA